MTQSRTKLTDAVVSKARLPEGKSEVILWDTEVTGFGLRLRGESKSYILAYRPAGAGRSANMKRLRLGTPETVSTATEARRLAKAALGRIASGGDPVAERQESQRKEKSRVGDLLDRYEKDLERRGYVDLKPTMSSLRSRLARHKGRDVAELTGADLMAIVDRLVADGLPGAAKGFQVRARAWLSWCLADAKVLSVNPLAGFRRQRDTRADRLQKVQHGRALSDDELIAVWRAADPATAFGRLVRFLILTGCRRGEAAGLTHAMVNREKAIIELPAGAVKQGRAHRIAISPILDRLLHRCAIHAGSPLVFPSPVAGQTMTGWSKSFGRLVRDSGVDFTPHDLRRSFRSGLSRLGVDVDTAERALGHARAELVEVYDRDRAEDRVGAAFGLWAAHIERILHDNAAQQTTTTTASADGDGVFG